MYLSEKDYDYLSGKMFSNSYSLKLEENVLYDRIKTLLMLSRGKRVLHIGCCDHLPLIDEKIQNREWLHALLDETCEYVLGVDINQEAVDYVNSNKLSKLPVYCTDITSPEFLSDFPKYDFDLLILGEIVEHVDNPVDFLKCLKNNMGEYGFTGKYIITVPNAISTVRYGLFDKGVETINSDHKFWFTPYTISKVMTSAGIMPEQILFSSYGYGGNGANRYTNKIFSILEKIRKKPFQYKSWRGDQIVILGKAI